MLIEIIKILTVHYLELQELEENFKYAILVLCYFNEICNEGLKFFFSLYFCGVV